jgi:hypothetical protein
MSGSSFLAASSRRGESLAALVEEEMPGDFQTRFRLRVDGNLIAENMTELESQF